jgi:hypothetical protein
MINPYSMARTILATKSGGRIEHAREMGLRNCGPCSPERRLKMAAALYALNVLSPALRRIYRAERRSRWLTNCIVEHPERGLKTFDLEGCDPLTGRRFAVHLQLPLDASLCDFLNAVMRCPTAPVVMRLDAAKNAAVLMHRKPRPVITAVEYERWLERLRERHREASRRSYARLKAAKAGEARGDAYPSPLAALQIRQISTDDAARTVTHD